MRILSLFLVVFALTGCSGTTIGGNEDKLTPAYLKQHLIVGKSSASSNLFGWTYRPHRQLAMPRLPGSWNPRG